MRRKRKKDAEVYHKILNEQIEEKNKRKLKSETMNKRLKEIIEPSGERKTPDNINTTEMRDLSPAVASSKYSNANTAATRNLFTPSEDN
jgi:hypothetical protein